MIYLLIDVKRNLFVNIACTDRLKSELLGEDNFSF